MTKTDTVSSYITKISQAKDGLAAVGEVVQAAELVRISLGGFSKKWDVFVDGIVPHENMPCWERFWDDFHSKGHNMGSKNVGQQSGYDGENVSLATKRKKNFKNGSKGGICYPTF